MHTSFYSCSVIIVCSTFSLRYLFLCWYLLFVLIDHRKERRHYFTAVVFSCSSLPVENTSCLYIYIYINQKCERLRLSFFCCIGQIWPQSYYYPDSSIRYSICLRTTRIERVNQYSICIKKSSAVYIEEQYAILHI